MTQPASDKLIAQIEASSAFITLNEARALIALIARIKAQDAEIARLTAFVDEDKADADKWRGLATYDSPMNSFDLWKDRAIAAEAEIARLREALDRSARGWDNVIELKLIPDRHVMSASILRDEALKVLKGGDA